MLLAIDSGNTNVVFAVYDGDRRLGVWRCANDPGRTADEYAVWLMQLMERNGVRPGDISATAMACVVPETGFNLESLCRRYFDAPPLIVGQRDVKLGFKVLVDEPGQVGADRLVNAAAGFMKYGGPLIILDFGTATTFDIVDADGNYGGGVIAPGINLSLGALYRAAAKLPLVEIAPPPGIIGKNTVAAMQSGIFWGYVAMIEGLTARIAAELGTKPKVVATGGLSDLFAAHMTGIDGTDRGLTLDGLAEIYRRNLPGSAA